MRTLKPVLMLALLSLGLGGCNAQAPADTAHTSRHALDWAGTYRGTLPCADCTGIQTVVTLNGDGSFQRQSRYNEKSSDAFAEEGSIAWSADGQRITLGSGEDATHYQVAENALIMLDREGNRITGSLAKHYVLAKQAEPTLTETYWKLTELRGKPVGRTPKEPHITLRQGGRYDGTGGCNGMGGSYEVTAPNRIHFARGVSTLMACINGMEVEGELSDVLSTADSYSIHNNRLQLNRARMAPLAMFEAVYLY